MTSNLAWLLTLTEPWELQRQVDGGYFVRVGSWWAPGDHEPVNGFGDTVEDAVTSARGKYERLRRAA